MASPGPQQDRENNEKSVKKEDGEAKMGSISFGFSKRIKKAITGKAEERDFLTVVEGKELKSTNSVESVKKDLVIPLILRNRLYRNEGVKQEGVKQEGVKQEGVKQEGVKQEDVKQEGVKQEDVKEASTGQQQSLVDSQAIKELIEESQKLQERWESGSEVDPNLSIPLLMHNKLLQDSKNKNHIKVESTEADYEQVPVKAYGLALLTGMGWKQEEGIGRNFKQDVKPKEYQIRLRGLGLGGDCTAIKDLEPTRPRRPPKNGEQGDKDDEGLVLGPGGCVLVQSGAHKDLYGKIEGVDFDNARIVVKLAIGAQSVTISQYSIRLVPQKEYDKYSKDLSRLSKAHKEKEKEKEQEREKERVREEERARELSEKATGKDEQRESRTERQQDREREQRKRKHREPDTDPEKPPAVKESCSFAPSWLQRDLRVRFIDKNFKGGKYYNLKMRIEDVIAPQICFCRTDDGRLLDDIKQTMLETIVPKGDADSIMVVLGEHRGQVGHILKRDQEKCRAMVQLEHYEEKLFTLDYDFICHYVGADA